MTKEELIKTLEEYDKEVNRLFKENKKLKSRINKALKYIGSITDVKVRYFDYRNFEKESLHISHEELKRRIKEQHLEGHFIEIDRNDILKILKGEE